MAKAKIELIEALRKTARNLKKGKQYEWGHMGRCNCGNLAQVVTSLDANRIHREAMQTSGDWSEHLNDYCPTSGLPFDDIISDLIAFGFDRQDLINLERLADRHILQNIPKERSLNHNNPNDVIMYLKSWADILEQEWLSRQPQPILKAPVKEILA